MPDPNPKKNTWLRWLAVCLAAALLVWLPFEDRSASLILVFAWAISLLLAVLLWRRRSSPSRQWRCILAGLTAGALVTPLALLLMAVKTSLHGHGAPDFNGEQVLQVIQLTPLWLLAGGLIGLGVGLLNLQSRSGNQP